MTKQAFATLRFGDWSRILVGQINRKHYYFAVDTVLRQFQWIHGLLRRQRDSALDFDQMREGTAR
jgi:hypothetical protein